MASLAESEISEKPRVIAVVVLTLATVAGTSYAMDALGFAWVWDNIHRLPFWHGLAVVMALWGGIMLAVLRGPRALIALARLAPAVLLAFARGIVFVAKALATVVRVMVRPVWPILTAIAGALEPAYLGLRLLAEPLLAPLAPVLTPLRQLWRSTLKPIIEFLGQAWLCLVPPLLERAARLRDWAKLEWTLWRAYRREFRGAFASYREFRRAFEEKAAGAGNAGQNNAPPALDPFAVACKTLGLPTDGNFSESQFKARYRALMKEVHPDIAGPNERAARVNAASTVIRKRKGWS